MERLTVIKLVLILTILIGNKILSVTNKILTSSRNNCRCGEINSTNRITGGKFTKPHAYPWQALILRHSVSFERYIVQHTGMCGGTVINNMYILTAAHCVVGAKEVNLEVALGLYDIRNKFNRRPVYKVVEIIIHDKFGEKIYDIAILKVNAWIKFDRYVKPICLQNQYERIEGKRATVIGWGVTKYNGSRSDILKEVTVQVLERKRCLERTAMIQNDYTMFCAYGGPNDACQGDSGGPIFYTNENGKAVQIGIVSTGDDCGKNPGVYTKISIFLNWIHKNTNDAIYCKRKM